MHSADYDPQTWTPELEPAFCATDVGQELIPEFHRERELTATPYDWRAHARVVQTIDRLSKPGRFLSPEEEFVASRMNYVARLRVESWMDAS